MLETKCYTIKGYIYCKSKIHLHTKKALLCTYYTYLYHVCLNELAVFTTVNFNETTATIRNRFKIQIALVFWNIFIAVSLNCYIIVTIKILKYEIDIHPSWCKSSKNHTIIEINYFIILKKNQNNKFLLEKMCYRDSYIPQLVTWPLKTLSI